jgi:hypothetical protein
MFLTLVGSDPDPDLVPQHWYSLPVPDPVIIGFTDGTAQWSLYSVWHLLCEFFFTWALRHPSPSPPLPSCSTWSLSLFFYLNDTQCCCFYLLYLSCGFATHWLASLVFIFSMPSVVGRVLVLLPRCGAAGRIGPSRRDWCFGAPVRLHSGLCAVARTLSGRLARLQKVWWHG